MSRMWKGLITAIVVIAITGLSLGSYFIYRAWDRQQTQQAFTEEQGTDEELASSGQYSSQSANQQQIASSGDPQAQVLSGSTSSNTTNASGSTSNGSSGSSGSSGSINPSDFAMYNKYQSYTSAMFADVIIGTGAEATAGKKVSMNYVGWLTNGTTFDQNVDSTKPFSFTLGAGNVITGWEQTVPGMKVGGERLLIIPPSVGYDNTANGPIPANSVLIFRVKLLSVE